MLIHDERIKHIFSQRQIIYGKAFGKCPRADIFFSNKVLSAFHF
jgi:hypothetical protein